MKSHDCGQTFGFSVGVFGHKENRLLTKANAPTQLRRGVIQTRCHTKSTVPAITAITASPCAWSLGGFRGFRSSGWLSFGHTRRHLRLDRLNVV